MSIPRFRYRIRTILLLTTAAAILLSAFRFWGTDDRKEQYYMRQLASIGAVVIHSSSDKVNVVFYEYHCNELKEKDLKALIDWDKVIIVDFYGTKGKSRSIV